MSGSKDDEKVRLERFDGTEPAVYKRWRRKAELMLLALPSTFEKSRWGPKLCEYISGEAEELIEHLSITDLCKEDGYVKVLEALDEKYQKRKQEEAQTYLKEYFYKSVIKQGETYRQFIVRLETTYRHLTAHNIELPSEVKGWFLLKKLCLDNTQEALVLTASAGSLKYKSITEAIYKVMPEGKCLTNVKTKDVFVHDVGEEREYEEVNHEETVDDVFEAIAEVVQAEDGDYEDGLEVFETYTEIRKKMQSQKMARGFKQFPQAPLHLTGTMQAKIQQLKDRTRCHICMRPGHWKRECPKKDQKGRFGKGGGKKSESGQKNDSAHRNDGHETMVADYESQNEVSYFGMSPEACELSDRMNEVFFSEDSLHELEKMIPNTGSFVQEGGTSSVDVFTSVVEQHFADSDDAQVYMAESSGVCSLATHAVPDTACRRTLVGERTLRSIETELRLEGKKVRYFDERNVFKFGNNECLEATKSALIPVQFGHKSVVLKAAVLPGKGAVTPLLLSKELLKQLGTRMDLSSSKVCFDRLGVTLEMGVTSRGHFAIPMLKKHAQTHTHKCSSEDRETESFQTDSVTDRETAALSQALTPPGPVTVYARESCHGSQLKGHHHGPDASDQSQTEPGEGSEGAGVPRVTGSASRSAKRRARRRKAAGRKEVCDGQTQEQGVSRCVCGRQELHRVDSSECDALQSKVVPEHVGVSTLRGGEGSVQEDSRWKDQADESLRDCTSASVASNAVGSKLGGAHVRRNRDDTGGLQDDVDAGDSRDQEHPAEHGEREDGLREKACSNDEADGQVDQERSECAERDEVRMTKAERRSVKKSLDGLILDSGFVVDVLTVCDGSVHDQDVMELFSTPNITATAQKMSLKADYAFDVKLGCDLRSPEAKQRVREVIKTKKPELVVVCPPCGPFSVLQRFRKIKGEQYEKALSEAKDFLAFAMEVCTLQHNHGRKFVFEHPWEAESWFEDCVKEVLKREGTVRVRLDQCMFNLRDVVSKKRHKKPTGIMTNCKQIAARVNKVCSGRHAHEPIFGSVKTIHGWKKRSELAQRYPRELVHAIISGFLEYKHDRDKEIAVSTVYAVEIFAKETDERHIMSALKRCHENLGHPSNARLISMLKSANANETTIRLAKGLTCPTCESRKGPPSRPVSKEKKAWEFNKQIMIDTFEVDVLGKKLKLLNVVDEATGYQMVAPLWHGCAASNVRSCYRKFWKRWAGVPLRVLSDNGKEFEGDFTHGLEMDGSMVDTTAAMSPHQNGMVERRGGVWKTTFDKVVSSTVPTVRQEVDEIIDQVNFSVNTLPRVDGYSPYQHVFGKESRIPGGLDLKETKDVESSALQAGETMYLRRQAIRHAAHKSYLEAHEEDRVRRAVNHRTRPDRGPFSPGELVYFWRMWPKEKKAYWHGPGTVIGFHNGRSKIWVAKGAKMYKCSPEQLRKVSSEQEAILRMLPEDLIQLGSSLASRGSGNYIDLSIQGKPPQDPQGDDVGNQGDMDVDWDRNLGFSGLDDGSHEGRRVRPRRMDDMGDDDNSVAYSPSINDEFPGDVPQEPNDHGNGNNHMSPLATESLESDEPQREPEAVTETDQSGNVRVDQSVPQGTVQGVEQGDLPQGSESREEYGPVRQHRPLTIAMRNSLNLLDSGRPRNYTPPNQGHDTFMVQKKRGRKEVFENELFKAQAPGLRKAKNKEWNKLISSGAVRVLSKSESEQILGDPQMKKRVLKSRFVITKAEDVEMTPETELKARWCIRGYLDPDLLTLDTEAPTLSAEGCSIALQCVASHKWDLQICDVEGAFLRGEDLKRREGRVFVYQPPGGIDSLESGTLIEAVKAVYGLADAPLAWYQSFSKNLKALGCRQSKFDNCLYYAYSKSDPKKLIGVLALHVDDMCLGGNQEFNERIVEPLKKLYPFKHWHQKKGDFLGRWVEQKENGDIVISQSEYASKLKGIDIDTKRKRDRNAETNDDEKQQMRAVLGAVNWLVSGTRPDLAASCSLLQQKVSKAVIEDLVDVNRLVKHVHDYSHLRVKIKSIKPERVCFMAVSDAAWANASGKFSQAGYMVAAVDKQLMNDVWADFSLLRWKSYKQDRRTPSTLGAELYALSRALAETRWMRSMWCEAVFHEYQIKENEVWEKKVPMCAIVDNKPLFDHANSKNNTNIKDKRHAIEMLIVKEDLRAHNIHLRWVATYQMLGDILTKRGVPVGLIAKIMDWGKFIIAEDESIPRNHQKCNRNYFGDV